MIQPICLLKSKLYVGFAVNFCAFSFNSLHFMTNESPTRQSTVPLPQQVIANYPLLAYCSCKVLGLGPTAPQWLLPGFPETAALTCKAQT